MSIKVEKQCFGWIFPLPQCCAAGRAGDSRTDYRPRLGSGLRISFIINILRNIQSLKMTLKGHFHPKISRISSVVGLHDLRVFIHKIAGDIPHLRFTPETEVLVDL